MKTLLISCTLFFVFSNTIGQTPEKDLLSIESKRLEAIVARDHAFLTNLYDDAFHGVIATGHMVDKPKMVEFLETYNPYVIQSIEEVKVSIYGMVAITTGKLLNKSKSGSVIGQTRFTHIYLKRNDQWKMIESQGTIIVQE
jgi:hypothetical protein